MAELPTQPPDESNSRRVLRGFAAMSASSFGVMAVQLGYAAVTSRLLPPSAFGAYAVALSGVGLIGMLGGSSLGQSAARRDHDSVHLDRSLVTLAVIVGCAAALVAILLAPIWGTLWGVPESVPVTRVLALGIPVTALAAVLAGILRRSGRTPAVAGRTAIGQLTGMAVGLAAVLSMETAWSLAVAAVAGAVVTGALLAASLPRQRLVPTRPTSASVDDAVYGVKSAGMNLLRYGTNLLPVWAIGRFAGASSLGAYNRATTLLTMPLEALQRSLSYSLFPELRPRGPVSGSGKALTDIMILITWPALFIGGVGYFAAGPFSRLVLGPGWETAESIAGVALLLGALQIVRTPLGSALEARAQFRQTLAGRGAGAVALCAGAAITAQTGSVKPAMLGFLGAGLAETSVYAVSLCRSGALSLRRLASGTKIILGLQAVATGVLAATAPRLPDAALLQLAFVSTIGAAELGVLWLIRRRTAFWHLGRTYGLPGFN